MFTTQNFIALRLCGSIPDRPFSLENKACCGKFCHHHKMNRKPFHTLCFLLVTTLWVTSGCGASPAETTVGDAHPALRDATILLIRHAEKPDDGFELAPAGQKRADAYAQYFKTLTIDGQPMKPDYLFATADSKNSHRPRLTLEPTSHALGLKLDLRFKTKNPQAFVDEIQSHPHGQHILIAWHHGEISQILNLLGANPAALLPDGKWPSNEFSWIIALRFDHDGRLLPGESKCIHEKLMPGDS